MPVYYEPGTMLAVGSRRRPGTGQGSGGSSVQTSGGVDWSFQQELDHQADRVLIWHASVDVQLGWRTKLNRSARVQGLNWI